MISLSVPSLKFVSAFLYFSASADPLKKFARDRGLSRRKHIRTVMFLGNFDILEYLRTVCENMNLLQKECRGKFSTVHARTVLEGKASG
jgi:hypothetical protein